MHKIYLDDIRTPHDPEWIVVRSYQEFTATVEKLGLSNITEISLDHDLGPQSMSEYFHNVSPNYTLDYKNITNEKTGYDCAKWLVNHYYDKYHDDNVITKDKRIEGIVFPKVYTHSANPIGSANIMGYINNFFMNEAQPQTCIRVQIAHKV